MAAHRASFPLRLQQILAGSRAVSPAIKVESEPVSPLLSPPVSGLPHIGAASLAVLRCAWVLIGDWRVWMRRSPTGSANVVVSGYIGLGFSCSCRGSPF